MQGGLCPSDAALMLRHCPGRANVLFPHAFVTVGADVPEFSKGKELHLGVIVGNLSGPLLLRCYYLHGGKRKWLTSWVQSVAFPILLIPISASLLIQSSSSSNSKPLSHFLINPNLFYGSVLIGALIGADSFLFALGLSYLPASTSALLMATQLAFTAVFAFFLVKQKFTAYTVNSVVLLTLGCAVLGFHVSGDRPSGVSQGEYAAGFVITIAAAALLGFILPLIELVYAKASTKVVTYGLVMQVQFVASLVATVVCTVGMIVNKDFQAISREAQAYGLGETKYYLVIIFAALGFQAMVVGNLGVVFCSTSFFSGVLLSLLLPIQQVFAVIFFKEKFNAEKGMSLVLALWGFASYFYGEYKHLKKRRHRPPSVSENGSLTEP
ncbi:hypothetical protein Sjap_022487 [Stephania japonica]|uniref:Probable purine permease n=1 Tax=Stephania japonica TaxID=461633 RepID=A0AAP0HV17_9MAGN